jgi:hypothetical protein
VKQKNGRIGRQPHGCPGTIKLFFFLHMQFFSTKKLEFLQLRQAILRFKVGIGWLFVGEAYAESGGARLMGNGARDQLVDIQSLGENNSRGAIARPLVTGPLRTILRETSESLFRGQGDVKCTPPRCCAPLGNGTYVLENGSKMSRQENCGTGTMEQRAKFLTPQPINLNCGAQPVGPERPTLVKHVGQMRHGTLSPNRISSLPTAEHL